MVSEPGNSPGKQMFCFQGLNLGPLHAKKVICPEIQLPFQKEMAQELSELAHYFYLMSTEEANRSQMRVPGQTDT